MLTAHRPPGGAWSAPVPVTTPSGYDPLLPGVAAAAPVPGAGAIVAVEKPSGTGKGPKLQLFRVP